MRIARRLPLLFLLGLGGCNVIGALAAKAPRPDIDAAYKKLEGQSVGVMIWADRSLLMDWPNLQIDMANNIANKLLVAQVGESKNLKGTTFPYPPASFVKYQKEHPEIAAEPITEIAPKLGVTRLIYVEVNDLSTRAQNSVALFLGRADVSLHVIEVDPNAKGKARDVAKAGYEENSIVAQFPDKATQEGVLNANDRAMYIGAVNAVTTEVVKRLIQHPDDSD